MPEKALSLYETIEKGFFGTIREGVYFWSSTTSKPKGLRYT